jgi:D-ribose pyranase
MKKVGLLHNELSKTIAEMGHEDLLLIGDAGMPVPKGVKLIDLALVKGVPGFFEVLKAVLSELHVQEGIIDQEMQQVSPHMKVGLDDLVKDSFKLTELPHEEVKKLSASAKAVVRTGEFTPYSNIILKAGVLF